MSRVTYIFLFGLIAASLASCTSARWTVKEKAAVDKDNYKVLKQKYFLQSDRQVTPKNPILQLDLYSQTKYQYTERVLMQRNIQKYRLRPGFVALGLSGAAMAFYLANGSSLHNLSGSAKTWTLNTAGALFLVSGFLNMKPVGKPRPTGEERYLRSTGLTTQIDTVQVGQSQNVPASVTVRYQNSVVFEEQRSFTGTLEIPLANKLEELQLSGPDPGSVNIQVVFNDSTYRYRYPVDQILQPYAKVTSKLSALRNTPEETPDNVLADLVKGSRLQIKDSSNDGWYEVLYGISENYIRKDDAEMIWRSTGFANDNNVVTVPRIPFGNIDVESNIPILRGPSPNAVALIVTNENYSGDLEERNYAHRDGQLIKAYLKNALGYQAEKIYELQDVSRSNELYRKISELRFASNDSTELFIYLSGYGRVDRQGQKPKLNLLGVAQQGNQPPVLAHLSDLFEQLSTITKAKTVVLSDIDFSSATSGRITANEGQRILEASTTPLRNDPRASVLMGTQLSYPSSLYVSSTGEDKKHHIFPYFFAKALQQRKTKISAIYQYLERNVSYTARRLYDRPQDPLLLGNTSIDLISR